MSRNVYIGFYTVLFLFFAVLNTKAQKTKDLKLIQGVVTNENGKTFSGVRYIVLDTDIDSFTNEKGQFAFQVPEGTYEVVFTTTGYQIKKKITVHKSDNKQHNIRIAENVYELKSVVKKNEKGQEEAGTIYIKPKDAHTIAGPIGGIEGIIKTIVGSTNELTSQYSVRGGNYDENLVYVNDFEIYRPFLVRSGQQEGLSFVNADLASGVNFSVGGFQSKYGDKMSSVLDVTYKRPTQFAGSAMLSLLGGSLHLEGASKNQKLKFLFGARQKSNQYLLQSQPTKGVYNPSFTDIQGMIHYQINDKLETEVIVNYARNRFSFLPESSVSTFGLFNKAYSLTTYYEGQEIDQFDSKFGGYSLTYKPNDRLKLKFLASIFQTNERETYDITGEYRLGEIETDLGKSGFGQMKNHLGTSVIQDFARNYLDVQVATISHRGSYLVGKHFLQWGLDYSQLNIKDKLHQYQRRDSAGFTQPVNTSSLEMKTLFNTTNSFSPYRITGYIQDNFRFHDSVKYTGSIGLRYLYNSLNGEQVWSPRLQLGLKPNWEKEISFKFAAGYYAQPAFYRELRDLKGVTNTNVLAQKSFHIVTGAEHNFTYADKPFKITAELYYKNLWDLVPYEYDGIKIRYYGDNTSKGYTYGGEVRLYADLVKNATSWLSFGVMKSAEQIWTDYKNQAGGDSISTYAPFIPRPTDQRFMIAMFFQDYLPQNENLRAHINLMYGSGLPFGPPNGNRSDDVFRMPSYKRVDIGFSALLLDGSKPNRPSHSFFRQFKSIWISAEIFNILNIQNTLSYNWIQDQSSNLVYAVPNRLTARLFNVKMIVSF
jgi:hypothetical protein